MPTEPLTKERRAALEKFSVTGGVWPGRALAVLQETLRELTAAEQALAEARRDTARLDWLQEEIVDTIYMDDGRIIDVRGKDVRKSMDVVMSIKGTAE